jgi:hypothetical protein
MDPRFWFLGALSSAIVSVFFWVLGRRAGDRTLTRATAVVALVCCVVAFYFASQL